MPQERNKSEIDAILEDLQGEIARHREALGELGVFAPPQDPVALLCERQRVNSHLPIGWPVMPRGIWPKIVAYAQKITRRLLRWYINPVVDQQNDFNAAVTSVLSDVIGEVRRGYERTSTLEAALPRIEERVGAIDAALPTVLEDLEQSLARLTSLEPRVSDVAAAVRDSRTTSRHLADELGATREECAAVGAHSSELDGQVRELFEASEQRDAWLRDLDARLASLKGAVDAARTARDESHETTRLRLQRLENRLRGVDTPTPRGADTRGIAASHHGVDYYRLGAELRSSQQMASRLGDYDDVLVSLLDGSPSDGRALEIGAGRGEYVEHLSSLGFDAYGVDIDEDAVVFAKESGLDVRLQEGSEHLATLADESLAAIAMVQVVEHLDVDDLLRLFRLCHEKLRVGGRLVVETINPACLTALSTWYLRDPSHRTPIHPELGRFLAEQAGFGQIEIRYLHPVPEGERLSVPEQGGIERRNVELLNRLLFGPQDYALICTKPAEV